MKKLQFQLNSEKLLYIKPTNIILFSFLAIIFIGSLLLCLPFATRAQGSIPYINALFTATSATCITGLVVYDTLTTWTLFGQLVILSLIQIGGLGIVTLATFFTTVLRKKIGMKGRLIAQESINYLSFASVISLIKKIILITFSVELLGAILLSIPFVSEYGSRGIYLGVFHSISAFCNAGFDIMGNFSSLTAYNGNYYVIFVVSMLIIVGGLGFMVWQDLFEHKNFKNLLLHTRIVLMMTGMLIFGGTILFFIFEFSNNHTMGTYSLTAKFMNSFFQSVTTRTAGFNTFSLDSMSETSKIQTIVLMFIGAAPGSTAGGVKVTTIGVLLAAIYNQVKGKNEILMFKRKISYSTIMRALSIVGLGVMWVIIVTSIVVAVEKHSFINSLFEVTSAFGTVGLSTGMTPSLHFVSKILLSITMFLGRVGPMTFAISIALRNTDKKINMVYPEGKVMVG